MAGAFTERLQLTKAVTMQLCGTGVLMHEQTTNICIFTAVWQYGRCLQSRPRTMLHGPHHQDPILMCSFEPKIRVSHEAGCQGSSKISCRTCRVMKWGQAARGDLHLEACMLDSTGRT